VLIIQIALGIILVINLEKLNLEKAFWWTVRLLFIALLIALSLLALAVFCWLCYLAYSWVDGLPPQRRAKIIAVGCVMLMLIIWQALVEHTQWAKTVSRALSGDLLTMFKKKPKQDIEG
jgi:hypothetical protein